MGGFGRPCRVPKPGSRAFLELRRGAGKLSNTVGAMLMLECSSESVVGQHRAAQNPLYRTGQATLRENLKHGISCFTLKASPIFWKRCCWACRAAPSSFLLAPIALPETAICMFPCRRQVQGLRRAKCGTTHFGSGAA